MTVLDCALGDRRMTATEARDTVIVDQNAGPGRLASAINQLRAAAGLCNAAHFDVTTMRLPIQERTVYGDATDQAILRFSESLGPVAELHRCWQTKFELAFNSKNKFMIRAMGMVHPDGKSLALPESTAAVFEPADMCVPWRLHFV
jgi:sodium/potassium-transporting ATPase subunit alpha